MTRHAWDELRPAICEDFIATGEGLLVPTEANRLDPKEQLRLAEWGRAGADIAGCSNGAKMHLTAGSEWSLLLRGALFWEDTDRIERIGDFNEALVRWGQDNKIDVRAALIDTTDDGSGGKGTFGYCADGETTESKGKQGACSWHDGLSK